MKKSLLFMAVLFLTAIVFVKAQTPVTWIANTYCTNLALAADAPALTPLQQIAVGDLTFTAHEPAGFAWLYKVSADPLEFTYNGVVYSASQVQGQTNPSKGSPKKDGGYSSVAVFNSTTYGTLDVAFKFGYNKNFWVAAIPEAALEDLDLTDSTAVSQYAYSFAEGQTYWGGFFDPTTTPPAYYQAATPNAQPAVGTYFTGITLNIRPDYEYYVFFSGSKIMLCGLTYTATSGLAVKETISNASVISTEYYNLLGQKFTKPQFDQLNIVVSKMSDGSVKVDKKYIVK